jgi:hypothetical protein
MKRTVLLLAILVAFSITSVSQVHASPVIGEKAVAVSSWLSYYFANFLRAHRHNLGGEIEERIIVDDGSEVILRGDADDYANGRGDTDGIGPVGPSDNKRNTGIN